MTNHYETIRAALEGARTTARICVLGGLAKETDDALTALAELERAASEPALNRHSWVMVPVTPTDEMINAARCLLPNVPRVCMDDAIERAIAAAPQPQVGVTDEMCSRVWLSKFPQYQHAGDLQREMAMSWLAAWQSELGPALGMVAFSQRGFVLEIAARADAEIAELRRDAERYRFLRSCNIDMRNRLEHYADSALDTAIDAARGGE